MLDEEQEENHQPEDIARCRANFLAAMERVEAALKPEEKVMKPVPPKPDDQQFIVYFDFDKADLTQQAETIISKAVQFANSVDSQIRLRGHTDLSGSADYNLGLSERRNESVILKMLDIGAKANTVRAVALGETEPAVPTEDGVRHPKNRRVEIVVSPVK